jgi:hypothetical protein
MQIQKEIKRGKMSEQSMKVESVVESVSVEIAPSAGESKKKKIDMMIGCKGFAKHHKDGKYKACRILTKSSETTVLVSFFEHPDDAAQNTKVYNVKSYKVPVGGIREVAILPEPAQTPFNVGDKVWGLKKDKWERGRVVHVYGAYGTALINFYEEKELPVQNTKFTEMSYVKPA